MRGLYRSIQSIMDGGEKTTETTNVDRSRRKGSLSSLSKLHKPNYNPDKYVDTLGNCSADVQSLPNESPTPLTNSRLTQWTGINQSSLSDESLDMSTLHIKSREKNLLKQSKTEGVVAASKPKKGGLNLYSVSGSQDLRSEDLVLSPPYVPDVVTAYGWSVPVHRGLTDEAMMSPESERSQTSEATSLSLMSTSVESGGSTSAYGSDVLALLLRQPSETVLAQQYFPVTFGATTPRPVNSRDPLLHIQPTLTLSKKLPSRSRSAGHHRHRRPGSGHSSSSSNSKSSVDRIYFDASDALQENGISTALSSTPYKTQLARLQREQLEIEEHRLRHLKIQEEVERSRGPVPNWYEIRSPQFHYEFRKHNEHLKGNDRQKSTRQKPNP